MAPLNRTSLWFKQCGDLQNQSSSTLATFNTFAGGAVDRMAIFALNMMPYIAASIIMRLAQQQLQNFGGLQRTGYKEFFRQSWLIHSGRRFKTETRRRLINALPLDGLFAT